MSLQVQGNKQGSNVSVVSSVGLCLTVKRVNQQIGNAFCVVSQHETTWQVQAMQLQAQPLCYSHVQHAQGDGDACAVLQHHVDAAIIWVVVVLVVAFEACHLTKMPA